MPFPKHKTKLVATIGPASEAPEVLRDMIDAGLDIARLNLSHNEPEYHQNLIRTIRRVAAEAGRRVAIMADLPGPKIRIGEVDTPIELVKGQRLLLTSRTEPFELSEHRPFADDTGPPPVAVVSVSYSGLPQAVKQGDMLFINDGFIQLEVLDKRCTEVLCRVLAGGELSSRKGLHLPGISLGLSAFTPEDRRWLGFAAENGIDAVSQSFVEKADDIIALRQAAVDLGYQPFVIAKIERAAALDQLDSILQASDGIMVARGDLGVEIPIESIAAVQRRITRKANRLGKPVITATQMLESMTSHRRPTRAEATDVANAILAGTDCVMLSAESAMGRYPVESVAMLAAIACSIEPEIDKRLVADYLNSPDDGQRPSPVRLISHAVFHLVEKSKPRLMICPTRSGAAARNIARLRLPCQVVAFCPNPLSAQGLQFSFGVLPIAVDADRADWNSFARSWLKEKGVQQGLALLVQGPSEENPEGNHRLELVEM